MYRTTKPITIWLLNGQMTKVAQNDWLEYMGQGSEVEMVMKWNGQLCLVPINYFRNHMMFMG